MRLTQKDFAQRAGLTSKQVIRIEQGKVEPRAATLDGLDTASQWATGTAQTILDGSAAPGLRLLTPPAESDVYERELRDEVEREMFLITELSEDARWASIVRRRKRIAAEYAASQGLGRTGR